MKAYWRSGGISSTHSLTSALDGGECSASRPGRFTPREEAAGIHCIGGWMGPRAVLDAVSKRKIPSSRRESNHRTPIVQAVAQRYIHWAITALTVIFLRIVIVQPHIIRAAMVTFQEGCGCNAYEHKNGHGSRWSDTWADFNLRTLEGKLISLSVMPAKCHKDNLVLGNKEIDGRT
jgi:hypothetical protein